MATATITFTDAESGIKLDYEREGDGPATAAEEAAYRHFHSIMAFHKPEQRDEATYAPVENPDLSVILEDDPDDFDDCDTEIWDDEEE